MAPGKATFSKSLQNVNLLKDPLKGKKTEKRPRKNLIEEEDEVIVIDPEYQENVKKLKSDLETEAPDNCKNNILNFFGQQEQARKQYIDNIFKSLAEIKSQIEADCDTMKENELKQEQIFQSSLKCARQATAAFKQRLDSLNELEKLYKKQEFHAKGHGLAAINMLAQSNDTQTKRLVQQYEKLKTEGVPEEELVEKSATAVGIERKEQHEAATLMKSAKATPENPNSVTAQVLAESDLKKIFKE